MRFDYLGLTTHRRYVYTSNQNPTNARTVTLNGETCVPCNPDGAVMRGVQGPPPPTDPYGFTVIPSVWEQGS